MMAPQPQDTSPALKSLAGIYTRVAQGEALTPNDFLHMMDEAEAHSQGSAWQVAEELIAALPGDRRATALHLLWVYGRDEGKPADLLDKALAAFYPPYTSSTLLITIAPHYAPQNQKPFNTARLAKLMEAGDRFTLHTRKYLADTLGSMYGKVPEAKAMLQSWRAGMDIPPADIPAMTTAELGAKIAKLRL